MQLLTHMHHHLLHTENGVLSNMLVSYWRYCVFCYLIYSLYLTRYATASARSDGLLLLCGGRDANSVVSQIGLLSCLSGWFGHTWHMSYSSVEQNSLVLTTSKKLIEVVIWCIGKDSVGHRFEFVRCIT